MFWSYLHPTVLPISILSSLPTQLTIPSYPPLLKFTKSKLCCQNILGSVAFSWSMVSLLTCTLREKHVSVSQVLCMLSQSLSAYVQLLCHVQKWCFLYLLVTCVSSMLSIPSTTMSTKSWEEEGHQYIYSFQG